MIACIIEFGVKEGRDEDRKRLLAELFVELDELPDPGRRPSMMWIVRVGGFESAYWTDADALRGWMVNAAHIRAIGLGKREIFQLRHQNCNH